MIRSCKDSDTRKLVNREFSRKFSGIEKAARLRLDRLDAAMSLKGQPLVQDIRTIGLVAGIDLAPEANQPGRRAYRAMESGFHDHDIMLRITGDTLALSPPLIIEKKEIDQLIEIFAGVLKTAN